MTKSTAHHAGHRSLYRLARGILALCLLAMIGPTTAAALTTKHGALTSSWQFDAKIDAQGVLHLIADQYYRFDLSGNLLSVESQAQDLQQYNLAFPPALDLDPQGNAHVLTRGAGSVASGVDVRYRVRNTDGSWQSPTRNYTLGPPEPRNYVVAVAAVSEDEVYAHHGKAISGTQGDLVFWKLEDTAPQLLGSWSGVWRVDLDSRMLARHGKVYFASANMVSSSSSANRVYFAMADADDSLLSVLKANVKSHTAGSGRRGGPDLKVDKNGNAHLSYGTYHAVYYNRYRANGSKMYAADKLVLSGLGSWHLNFGIASLGISDDGSRVLVAGLKTDNSKLAHNSELLLTWSTNGGVSWSEPIATGIFTHGGESRMRPRILTHGGRFYLVYFDWVHNGLALASLNMNSLANAGTAAIPAISTLLLLNQE